MAMVARKVKLAKELERAGAMALSNELLLLDADRGSQGTELEEDCAPAVEDER